MTRFDHPSWGTRPQSITWTGSNVEDIEEWCEGTGIGFTVGSPYHNWRWRHRAYRWVALRLWLPWEWEPPEDPTVLELHPPDHYRGFDGMSHWTTVRPGDAITRSGHVVRGSPL